MNVKYSLSLLLITFLKIWSFESASGKKTDPYFFLLFIASSFFVRFLGLLQPIVKQSFRFCVLNVYPWRISQIDKSLPKDNKLCNCVPRRQAVMFTQNRESPQGLRDKWALENAGIGMLFYCLPGWPDLQNAIVWGF